MFLPPDPMQFVVIRERELAAKARIARLLASAPPARTSLQARFLARSGLLFLQFGQRLVERYAPPAYHPLAKQIAPCD